MPAGMFGHVDVVARLKHKDGQLETELCGCAVMADRGKLISSWNSSPYTWLAYAAWPAANTYRRTHDQELGQFFFTYSVTISNEGDKIVMLGAGTG